ncbi:hypothetical protein [Phormidesmis sp. 146-33]
MKKAIATLSIFLALVTIPVAIARQTKLSESQQVEKFKQVFPLIQQQKITAFKDLDWCRTFEYQKGQFTNNNIQKCTYDFDQKQKFRGFDPQAQKDFDQITRSLQDTHKGLLSSPKVQTLDVEFNRDTTPSEQLEEIASARLHVFAGDVEPICKVIWSCNVKTYVYQPGYRQLPEDLGGEIWHEKINQDWYIEWQDWN